MKTYIDFLNQVAKEKGLPEYRHMWVDAIAIHAKAAELYAEYAFEEGCKVQRTIDIQNATASIIYEDEYDYSKGIKGCEVDKGSIAFSELATNPFKQQTQ